MLAISTSKHYVNKAFMCFVKALKNISKKKTSAYSTWARRPVFLRWELYINAVIIINKAKTRVERKPVKQINFYVSIESCSSMYVCHVLSSVLLVLLCGERGGLMFVTDYIILQEIGSKKTSMSQDEEWTASEKQNHWQTVIVQKICLTPVENIRQRWMTGKTWLANGDRCGDQRRAQA